MNRLLAISFVGLYLLAMLRPVQPLIEYALNKDYIAEFLCINKDKPEMGCAGKCHLTKQIQKQTEDESQSALSVRLGNYPIGFVSILEVPKNNTFEVLKTHNHLYSNDYKFQYSYSEFHPPNV